MRTYFALLADNATAYILPVPQVRPLLCQWVFLSLPSSSNAHWCLSDWGRYKDRLLLRSQQVANSPELIRRLGIIAMNTPLEVDIVRDLRSS